MIENRYDSSLRWFGYIFRGHKRTTYYRYRYESIYITKPVVFENTGVLYIDYSNSINQFIEGHRGHIETALWLEAKKIYPEFTVIRVFI